MADEDLTREGELLAGKYRLERRLGAGGMGEVYRARNELVGRDVAIKVLRKEMCGHGEVVQRFLREARAANVVQHPNVVDVVDMGTDAQGVPFIVQELLHGHDLSRRLVEAGGRLSGQEVLALMIPVVDALSAAHARGVVHRDLKPENVFLTRTATGVHPKVLDFGISKITTPGEEKLTTTGTAMGTPTYMSPEQVQGSRDIDARADVWALGVMLYELISGVLPFQGPSAGAIFVAICTRDPAPLSQYVPGLPPDYHRIVERCMRREPERRYADATALLVDLRHLQAGEALESEGGAPRTTSPGPVTGSWTLDERVSGDARPPAAETFVAGAPMRSSSEGVPPRPDSLAPPLADRAPQMTAPPVVVTPARPRRTAFVVVGTAALTAALGLGFVATRDPSPRPVTPVVTAVRPRPTPVVVPPPTPVVAPAAIAAHEVVDAGAVVAVVVDASVAVAAAPVITPPTEESPHAGRSSRHGRHHRQDTTGVATPVLDPGRPATEGQHTPPSVGTTEYE